MFLEVFFVAAAGWLLFGNLETQSRVQRINRALEEGRPHDFLRDIDLELERRPSGPLYELLKLNRSAGLVYIGAFDETTDWTAGWTTHALIFDSGSITNVALAVWILEPFN